MSFGVLLRNCRKNAGITQEALGERLNVGKSTISEWESDKRSPDVERLPEIAAALGVPTVALLDSSTPASTPEDKITIFSRKARKLSPEEWQQLDSVARALFKKVFDEDE
ncbi:MAG: helix-turn-helix transcriptional regulator [Christensenellaceae bacterium]|nr:helix-turn-helix transcriptional regulator [Christensenellaceae bacterium]MEA5070254.1 helix-turn-helix transcriptional regulator [Christensenellaceae bacterium]